MPTPSYQSLLDATDTLDNEPTQEDYAAFCKIANVEDMYDTTELCDACHMPSNSLISVTVGVASDGQAVTQKMCGDCRYMWEEDC